MVSASLTVRAPAQRQPGLPLLIQGGMGVGASHWRLARVVSSLGHLGVISGTALDTLLVRRLQDGDPGGHVRRAVAHFPLGGVAESVLRRYFLPNGRPGGAPYKLLPMYKQAVTAARQQLTVLANFVEVWLAKEGHGGQVGLNLLTKVQMPTLASLYGAMLAGVDWVLMGAGIPREIPGALDALAEHRRATLRLDVEGAEADAPVESLQFDPREHWPAEPATALTRPRFVPIVSATSLAVTLARKATGRVDGFVVEGPTAGGHNAPPRGEARFDARGQPVYGERDRVDLAKLRELGLPFWLAGGTGSPNGVRAALDAGAAGVQVGTLFAYCHESGITDQLKAAVLAGVAAGRVAVRTDPRASPTGYPFKVVEVAGVATQGDERRRVCDLGYLRVAYRRPDGRLGYRCAAEPIEAYVAKGGDPADAVGRRCLCNGLVADVGHAQERDDLTGDGDGTVERPLLTAGDDLLELRGFLAGRTRYSARDVVAYLVG
jgi:NAD(P)H-dependent flavin oxidoreductase YrpB (nitropropane dioxygenase family)